MAVRFGTRDVIKSATTHSCWKNRGWSSKIFMAASKLINLDFGTLVNMRPPCLPGAGPCLRQWMRDVSDGVWASSQHAWVRAVQTFWLQMQTKVTWHLHWYNLIYPLHWAQIHVLYFKKFLMASPYSNGKPRGWVTGLAHMPSLCTLSEFIFSGACGFSWNLYVELS